MKPMANVIIGVAVLIGTFISGEATDCTVSKEFRIRKPQALSGVLQDPYGAPLSGMELDLLSGRKVIRRLSADNEGRYDFGQVSPGKYRIHLLYGNDPFCAPEVQCGSQGCTLQTKLAINPKNSTLVK